ncbi:MAG: AEC family transporter [Pseudomonadota bacterium]|nr:AEC family transporter [Pseudomonadota bacterium]
MIAIFLSVLPVVLVLAAGYAGARTGYLPEGVSEALNGFAVRLAVPVLLFRALYQLDLSQSFYPPMLASFYFGAVSSFALAIVLARMVWKRPPGESVAVGFCAMFSNSLMLGMPIVERAFGEAALTPGFGIVALHAPVLYIVGMVTMELSRRDGRSLAATLAAALKSIFANALMIGILAGAALNLSGLVVPEPAMAAVDMLATAAIPAALVGIGATLTRYRITAELSESLIVSALALFLHPGIVLVLTHFVLGLPASYVAVAVIVAAMPPGMNVYIFATMYDRAVGLAATSVLTATTLSVVTISFWLFVIHALLPV